jgi:uncharacterized protein (TIGR02145 family)
MKNQILLNAAILLVASQLAYAEEWQTIDRYEVNDGLVKDRVTGLMWMRCVLGQEWNGTTCKGEIKKSSRITCTFSDSEDCKYETAKAYSWQDAVNLSNGFNYAGFYDWRLPTIEELSTLIYCNNGQPKKWNSLILRPNSEKVNGIYKYESHEDCKNSAKPTIFAAAFPNTNAGGIPEYGTWSSSSEVTNNNEAFVVSFYSGFISREEKNGKWGKAVRFVRDGR